MRDQRFRCATSGESIGMKNVAGLPDDIMSVMDAQLPDMPQEISVEFDGLLFGFSHGQPLEHLETKSQTNLKNL